jgi:hypothetical protein
VAARSLGEHPRKPNEFNELVNQPSPGSKVELFSRQERSHACFSAGSYNVEGFPRKEALKKTMNKKLLLAITGCLAMTACSLLSPDAQSVLQSSQKAMGTVKSIQYSGTGMNAFFGQALTAGKEWPRRPMTSYTRTINYDQKSGSEDMMFANLVFGGQHQNTQVSGDKPGPSGPMDLCRRWCRPKRDSSRFGSLRMAS